MMLGKDKVTKFGVWFDEEQEEYNMKEFANVVDISRDTMTTLCCDINFIPSSIVMKKVMYAVKRIDPYKRASHFWDV